MTDQIEKNIALQAPVSRVWQALTDYRQFGLWFGAEMDGPFIPGHTVHGKMGPSAGQYEGMAWSIDIKQVQPEMLFSFSWHPYAVDPARDYTAEPQTLVVFRLAPSSNGTLLTVTESGFDKLPADRRARAFDMNQGGWAGQMQNLARHVEQ